MDGQNARRAAGRHQDRYTQAQDPLTVLQAANAQRPPSQRRAPDKVVVSPGDPEAALGLDKDHVFRPLYTVQTVRDVETPLILATMSSPKPAMPRRYHPCCGVAIS